MLRSDKSPAILALQDGTVFEVLSVGADGIAVGELVFNTSMSGYQEILTDPSYSKQIVTFTYPHIGNVGVNSEDVESSQIHAAGMVIRDLSPIASNYRSAMALDEYLKDAGIVAISEIDTRHLTSLLREKGAQSACIMSGQTDASAAIAQAQAFAGLQGMDLAQSVSQTSASTWVEGSWQLTQGHTSPDTDKFHVVALDFGVKHNILRLLADRGCKITLLPAKSSLEDILAHQPDGVFLSNGPGDPEPCDYAIDAVKGLLAKNIPLFGICLGHQILALAAGAKTLKMKFGHHGANHPVEDLATKVVAITSQNHGFAVDEQSLPSNLVATHRSLFDGSLQGIRFTDKPAFSFQGHPEASPGPHDILYLFDQFIDSMNCSSPSSGAAS